MNMCFANEITVHRMCICLLLIHIKKNSTMDIKKVVPDGFILHYQRYNHGATSGEGTAYPVRVPMLPGLM